MTLSYKSHCFTQLELTRGALTPGLRRHPVYNSLSNYPCLDPSSTNSRSPETDSRSVRLGRLCHEFNSETILGENYCYKYRFMRETFASLLISEGSAMSSTPKLYWRKTTVTNTGSCERLLQLTTLALSNLCLFCA